MPLIKLPAKAGGRIVDSADLLAYFVDELGLNINNDTIVCYSDGSVEVDTDIDLTEYWKNYVLPEKSAIPPTAVELLNDALATITTISDLKTFLADSLIPMLLPSNI